MGRVETAVDPSSTAKMVVHRLHEALSWWDEVNESLIWQDRIFHTLAILYGVVAAVALVTYPFFDLPVMNFVNSR